MTIIKSVWYGDLGDPKSRDHDLATVKPPKMAFLSRKFINSLVTRQWLNNVER